MAAKYVLKLSEEERQKPSQGSPKGRRGRPLRSERSHGAEVLLKCDQGQLGPVCGVTGESPTPSTSPNDLSRVGASERFSMAPKPRC